MLARGHTVAAALLCAVATAACSGVATQTIASDEESTHIRWYSGSVAVDVALDLTTTDVEGDCVSAIRLGIDEALDFARVHRVDGIPCNVLRVTGLGDLVVLGQGTGYDWSTVELRVDRDEELLNLGPVLMTQETGSENVEVGFSAASLSCSDAPECDCVMLWRQSGADEIEVELSRHCAS